MDRVSRVALRKRVIRRLKGDFPEQQGALHNIKGSHYSSRKDLFDIYLRYTEHYIEEFGITPENCRLRFSRWMLTFHPQLPRTHFTVRNDKLFGVRPEYKETTLYKNVLLPNHASIRGLSFVKNPYFFVSMGIAVEQGFGLTPVISKRYPEIKKQCQEWLQEKLGTENNNHPKIIPTERDETKFKTVVVKNMNPSQPRPLTQPRITEEMAQAYKTRENELRNKLHDMIDQLVDLLMFYRRNAPAQAISNVKCACGKDAVLCGDSDCNFDYHMQREHGCVSQDTFETTINLLSELKKG